jgi:3-hydroxybutyryl-CoA dehydrogenase
MSALSKSAVVAVVGAGTMGAGIAQVAAAAGHPVILFDAFAGAAEKGVQRLAVGLDNLVAKGKMNGTDKDALINRITIANTISDLASADLVVEAILEDLDVKRKLFSELEGIVGPQAILGSNTSSISITSIARDLSHPERFVGMHFFNPAPVMKLVEVISGVATAQDVAETVFATAKAWGKVAVHAKSTPGFIVNRVARPYYAEALRLYEEQLASPATLDALLTGAAGFRLGPFALMDLIGHDVNYAVSESVFNAFYQEPRFRPSLVQRELVNAGHLGRKSGKGFYRYDADAPELQVASYEISTVEGELPQINYRADNIIHGVLVRMTDGRTAKAVATHNGCPVILFDYMSDNASRVAISSSSDVPVDVLDLVVAAFKEQGVTATLLADWPGLVAMRTIAMLVNEAFEAMLQGVANAEGIDNAMTFGVNYPKGPVSWAHEIGLAMILSVLDAIHDLTGDPRYRASMKLRMDA